MAPVLLHQEPIAEFVRLRPQKQQSTTTQRERDDEMDHISKLGISRRFFLRVHVLVLFVPLFRVGCLSPSFANSLSVPAFLLMYCCK